MQLGVEAIERLYRESRFLDAYALFRDLEPPESWSDTSARLIAGRTLENLGASRRAYRLHLATWRRDRTNPAALYYHALGFGDRHGPVEGLRLLDECRPDTSTTPPASRHDAHLRMLRARWLATLRDFRAAHAWLDSVEDSFADDPWGHVEKAGVLEREDRYLDALASAEHALVLRPGYRPGTGMAAHLLILLNRDAEAERILRERMAATQCASLARQLAMLLVENEAHHEALTVLDLVSERWPLAEAPAREWLDARRADCHHLLGNTHEAVSHARKVSGLYYQHFVRQLESAPEAPRRRLAVSFVRQHHVTCVPATIAAVSSFWGCPINQDEMARTITYDGTPDHEERHWLEARGWLVREFRVTWETAVALIARGVPFTLVTNWVRNAHLQAVIGCDERLKTFIIRDPTHRTHFECLAEEHLKQQAPFGPRGMILIPPDKAGLIDGVTLPDAQLYDAWYRLRRALHGHERDEAGRQERELQGIDAEHRLVWWAKRELAWYDGNPFRAHEATLALRKRYPDEINLQLDELGELRQLGHKHQHDERLRQFVVKRGADPMFWRALADELRNDARERGRALRYARRLVRTRPVDCMNLLTLANLLWDTGRFAEATKVYRLAACTGETVEHAWQSYFSASRHQREVETALDLLRTRWQRLREKSSQPLHTLCRCLDQLNRSAEAVALLQEALALRPTDGGLHLLAAEMRGRSGAFAEAEDHLGRARTLTTSIAWHRIAADLARWRGRHDEALRHTLAVLAANPLDTQAAHQHVQLLATTEGRAAALTWIGAQVDGHPHFLPFRQIQVSWLREENLAAAGDALDAYLAADPNDPWAVRERASVRLHLGHLDAALADAHAALVLDPSAPFAHAVIGQVHLRRREFAAARHCFRRAVELNVDEEWIFPLLLEACPEFADRVDAVSFLQHALENLPSMGRSILRFRDMAIGVLKPDELERSLDHLRNAQPDHWESWSASIHHRLATGHGEEALALAHDATTRFPLIPGAWADLADVHRFRGDDPGETAALEHAVALSPGWSRSARRLAFLHQRNLRPELAEVTLRAALRHDPLDAVLLADLAEAAWVRQAPDEAFAWVERAIRLIPGFDRPWELLLQWSNVTAEPERVLTLAEQLSATRPGDTSLRLRVVRKLVDDQRLDDALARTRTALGDDPTHIDAHDLHAYILSRLGRYDEALAACAPPVFKQARPRELLGRAAWIERQRGNHPRAIHLMTSVVTEHPDYYWAWQTLADWHEEAGDIDRAKEAAERMAAMNPSSPYPLGYLASLELRAGSRANAIAHLQRAIRIDPGYSYGTFTLVQLLCEDNRASEAEPLLALIRQQGGHGQALQAEVIVACARKDKNAALATLVQLAVAIERDTPHLQGAAEAIRKAGWSKDMAGALQPLLRDPKTNAEVGAIWMHARLAHGRSAGLRFVREASNGVRTRAFVTYIDSLGDKSARVRLLWVLWRHGKRLKGELETWGAMGFALANTGTGFRRALVRWMRGWSTREGVQPWMLFNLAHCLFTLGRDREAMEVVTAVLHMPADHSRASFVAWAACQSALDGAYEEADKLLAEFAGEGRFPFVKTCGAIARILVDHHRRAAEDRTTTWRSTRERLFALRKEQPDSFGYAYVGRFHAQALSSAAATSQSPWAWWYQLRYQVQPFTASLTQGNVATWSLIMVVAAAALTTTGAGALAVGLMLGLMIRALASIRR